jgi:hypothetical protein
MGRDGVAPRKKVKRPARSVLELIFTGGKVFSIVGAQMPRQHAKTRAETSNLYSGVTITSVGHYSRAFFDDGRPSCCYHCRHHLAQFWRSYERAKSMQKSTKGSVGEPDREPVSHCQRTVLVGFKSDFLGKHHVARN